MRVHMVVPVLKTLAPQNNVGDWLGLCLYYIYISTAADTLPTASQRAR